MVRLCVAGGRLKADSQTLFDEAARFYKAGDWGAAASRYHDVLELSPHNPDALHMLGVIAQQTGKPQLAVALFEDALAARPVFPEVRYNLAVVLRVLERDDAALVSARLAIDTDPSLAAAWDLIGQIYKDKGDYAEAERCFVRAITLDGNALHYSNYALLLMTRGQLAAACQAARRAELVDADFPPTILGNILQALGYPEMAAERFARARMLRPDFRDGIASEAMARLQIGDGREGWALWEQRPDLLSPQDGALGALPLWRGELTSCLIVYEDQGMGDAIQFMRYLPMLADYASKIILRIREPLIRLCRQNFPALDIIDEKAAIPAAEARCRLSSLPALFAGRSGYIPATPYLAADPALRAHWRSVIRDRPRPRIGIVWAGNPAFHHDYKRSVSFEIMQSLFEGESAHFVSLQKNCADCDAALTASDILNVAGGLGDFADTAALIAELDLIISVDTAVAHLAGGLGKPVWILLPFASDWRWLLGRGDSPWYTTARLFRQHQDGDWRGVVSTVAAEVKKFVSGDATVLRPPPWQGNNLRQNPDALPLPL